ncbi:MULTISPECIES: integrase arm-type DNA-binding domain-containing protein [unclassified Serratia (in: enterobacteria)]|uniref:integrase arm-type DNA-binding domain-containing protein n=1 Tax=unclassified Serratia (in: enterobacteria) TaxID=2647522 RepID=UPI0030766599
MKRERQNQRKKHKPTEGNQLYLLVKPSRAKYRLMEYRIYGKEKKLTISVYPKTSLSLE